MSSLNHTSFDDGGGWGIETKRNIFSFNSICSHSPPPPHPRPPPSPPSPSLPSLSLSHPPRILEIEPLVALPPQHEKRFEGRNERPQLPHDLVLRVAIEVVRFHLRELR